MVIWAGDKGHGTGGKLVMFFKEGGGLTARPYGPLGPPDELFRTEVYRGMLDWASAASTSSWAR
jgi:hypothetical protein